MMKVYIVNFIVVKTTLSQPLYYCTYPNADMCKATAHKKKKKIKLMYTLLGPRALSG